MRRLSFNNKGKPITLLFILMALGGLVTQAIPVLGQDETLGQDNSGRSCGECHLDYHDSWASGVHSIAYTRESFQEAWAAEDNDPACLDCHTTGYQPATETYTTENIQCEACHGQNPANHPPEPIVVNTEAGICGDCHTSTFDEWRHSLHAFNEEMGAIGCATCHNPHSQRVRFTEIDDLCLNCHQDNPDNPQHYANTYVHVTHNEIQFETIEASVDVTCASCHMHSVHLDELHQLADHTMTVSTKPCTDCHETLSETGQFDTLLDVDLQLAEERDELRMTVDELQTQLAALEETEDQGGPNYVQLTQGIIVGLGLGATVLWVILRRSNGSNDHYDGNGSNETDQAEASGD